LELPVEVGEASGDDEGPTHSLRHLCGRGRVYPLSRAQSRRRQRLVLPPGLEDLDARVTVERVREHRGQTKLHGLEDFLVLPIGSGILKRQHGHANARLLRRKRSRQRDRREHGE
jgi:hypothetical protein